MEGFIKKLYKENYGKFITYSIFKETLKEFAGISLIEKLEKMTKVKGIPEEI